MALDVRVTTWHLGIGFFGKGRYQKVSAQASSRMKKSRFDQAGSGATVMTNAAICSSQAATITTRIASAAVGLASRSMYSRNYMCSCCQITSQTPSFWKLRNML